MSEDSHKREDQEVQRALVRYQQWAADSGTRAVVVLEGRDTAGKDESLQFRTTWTAGWFLEHFDHPALVKKAPTEDS